MSAPAGIPFHVVHQHYPATRRLEHERICDIVRTALSALNVSGPLSITSATRGAGHDVIMTRILRQRPDMGDVEDANTVVDMVTVVIATDWRRGKPGP
jgi:hypothetical protein